MRSESRFIYEVWDKDEKIFEGSVRKVAEHFYTAESTVYTTHRCGFKYLDKYELKRRIRNKGEK